MGPLSLAGGGGTGREEAGGNGGACEVGAEGVFGGNGGGDFHLLAEQNEYGMMLFLLREAEVEQLLDWVLEVVLHFVVPEKEEELRTSSRFLLARTHHQWESLGVWVEEVALGWKELEHDFGQVLKYST